MANLSNRQRSKTKFFYFYFLLCFFSSSIPYFSLYLMSSFCKCKSLLIHRRLKSRKLLCYRYLVAVKLRRRAFARLWNFLLCSTEVSRTPVWGFADVYCYLRLSKGSLCVDVTCWFSFRCVTWTPDCRAREPCGRRLMGSGIAAAYCLALKISLRRCSGTLKMN